MGLRRFPTVLAAAVAAVALSLAARPGLARQAYIDDVILGQGSRGDLVVGFRVSNLLDARVHETLESGLPVRFTFRIRLEHPRRLRPDETLVDLELVRVLEKDNLKDRYRVTLDAGEVRDVERLPEALELMSRVQGVSLLPVEALAGRRPVFLRIKAQLQEFKLPFRLHYLFAFVSMWNVETEWYVVELPPRPRPLP